MDDNFNEVTLVEQDLLMTVDDFAKQEGVTPRTVYRWIELGRLDTVGRPIIYGTTFEFLQFFGLEDLEQLPDLDLYAAALDNAHGDSRDSERPHSDGESPDSGSSQLVGDDLT